jgi:hypothetical protein
MNSLLRTLLLSSALATMTASAVAAPPHNVILFVPDGLRSTVVTKSTAPELTDLKTKGVWFSNSHSIFPTFTTPNAASMATGHYPGDTGDFSNTIFTGYPQQFSNGTVTPFVENDQILGDIDDHFLGTVTDSTNTTTNVGYLDEETILAAARAAGFETATVGKVGPAAIFDHENSVLTGGVRDTRGTATVFVDDRTGSAAGIPLDPAISAAMTAAGVPTAAPGRGANGGSGNNVTPGTTDANEVQQDYFVQVVSDVLLPKFKADGKSFVLVFWSRDPDGTQHNQGDSLNTVNPGINGPTSLSAVANADTDLGRIRDALARTGLDATTDIIVAADHGFSTIAKTSGPGFTQSTTSFAATQTYQTFRSGALAQEVQTGFLPPGFVAIDIAHALGETLFDPDSAPPTAPQPVTQASYPPVDPTQPPLADGTRRQRPAQGDGVIGSNPANPDVVVAANGGSDLIYLPNPATAATVAPQVIATLLAEDYVSGVFVDDSLGSFAGTLPLSTINLNGTALTPVPTIVVNFKSTSTAGSGCAFATPVLCTVEIADSGLQQGQGMHGNFSRADTNNFMAAIGPDFKTHFNDTAPASNADIGKTIAQLLGLSIPNNGALLGRILGESFTGGPGAPAAVKTIIKSAPAKNGVVTVVDQQSVGAAKYFDAAGFPHRTVGLTQ